VENAATSNWELVLGVKGLPTTYLLDRDGNIRFQAIGGREVDHPEVEALIEALL